MEPGGFKNEECGLGIQGTGEGALRGGIRAAVPAGPFLIPARTSEEQGLVLGNTSTPDPNI